MGFAHQCGDKFTYWIRAEKDVFLKRRTIKTRRKNIGRPTECVNDNLMGAEFILLVGAHNRIDYDDDPNSIKSGGFTIIPEEQVE
jgi:hypothetical protein